MCKERILVLVIDILLNRMEKNEQLKMKDFDVIKELGTGSYGRVQLIRRKEDKKYYALKSMLLANAKQKEKDAALNEIRLLASISMPYVISYKGSFYVPELQSLCIVMEYADGGDLQGKINSRLETTNPSGFDQHFIWKSAHQLLKGLKGLHEHNIIHRDLKCANVFFVNGIAKIGDLNISKITDNGFASTQTGTPYYTSPEIWKGLKYDNKCDIWALGCIIYEMCTLAPPFRAEDFPGLFQAITAGKYEDIPSKYTKNLRDFIALCLKIEPSHRPSAAALLEKSYFADYQLTVQGLTSEIEDKVDIKIIDPIECPKVMRMLNERLPKSKFEENNKKTVGFAAKDNQNASSFKIKTLKCRSQKVINIDLDEPMQQKIDKDCDRRVPKFLSKNNVRLPPLQKQAIKSNKSLVKGVREQIKSMKNIVEKENKRILFK